MELEILEMKSILKLHHFIIIGLMIAISVLCGKIKSFSSKITKLEGKKD